MAIKQNYTVGRGEMYFAEFVAGTTVRTGERYIGNTPQFNITVATTKLDHFSSDRGIKTKDDSVTTQVDRTATLITDAISPDNISLFLFGDKSVISVASLSNQSESFISLKQGFLYQLGQSLSRPSGVRRLDNFSVTSHPLATSGVDYLVDLDRGRFEVIQDSLILLNNTTITVKYDILPSSRDAIKFGNIEKRGELRFVSFNSKGDSFDYFFPYVKLAPNGDFAMKGDEWQQIPLNVEIIELSGYAPGYIDGIPYIPASDPDNVNDQNFDYSSPLMSGYAPLIHRI